MRLTSVWQQGWGSKGDGILSTTFFLTIAVAGLIVLGAGIYALILFRRETRRAQFGRDGLHDGRHHRRLVM